MSIGLSWMPRVSPRAARVGAILAIFAMSAILGWQMPLLSWGGGLGVELVIGGILFGMFVLVAMRHIEFGAFAIVLTAFFVRFSLPTGTASRIPASMVLAALIVSLWIVRMVLKREIRLVPSSTTLPLLGFIVVAVLSLPWSWLSWRPEFWAYDALALKFQITQLGGLALMVLLPAVYLLALNIFRDVRWYKWLVIAMIAIALPDLLQRLTDRFISFGGLGISGPGMYHLWIVALLYAQVLFNQRLPRWAKILCVALILGWIFYGAVVKVKWVSGWMPSLIAIFYLTFLKNKKAVLVLALLLAIPVVLAADYYYHNVIIESQTDDSNRLWLWQTIVLDLTLTKAGILLGAGPAGYTPYFMTYYPGEAMSAHNNYVDIIAETGIIGAVFFVWFIVAVLRAGWQNGSHLQDGFLLAFNNGVMAGFIGMLAAMMLDDWFIPFAYNNGLAGFDMTVYAWILLGAMAGLSRFYTSPEKNTQGQLTGEA